MQIITLVNEKGGVGKTTLATHIAAGAACRGMKVMLVDADPQGHATISFGLKKAPGLYDLLVRDAEFDDVAVPVNGEVYGVPGEAMPSGHLWVIRSNVESRSIASNVEDAMIVKSKFHDLDGTVDLVIFDTPPTPSLLHGSIYLATDWVIYPTKLEYWSFDGLVESIKHRTQADEHRTKEWQMGKINVMGIVPTMFRAGTSEQEENLEKLRNQFGKKVWQPIPQRTIWTEATSFMRPVWTADKNSKAAGDAWELVDRVQEVLYAKA